MQLLLYTLIYISRISVRRGVGEVGKVWVCKIHPASQLSALTIPTVAYFSAQLETDVWSDRLTISNEVMYVEEAGVTMLF